MPMPARQPHPREGASRPGRPRQADLDQRLETAVLGLLRDGGPAR